VWGRAADRVRNGLTPISITSNRKATPTRRPSRPIAWCARRTRGGQRGGPPGQGGFANRGNRSGPRGRPGGGQGNGQSRAKGQNQGGGQPGNGPRRDGPPRGEADGNVAPREVDGNRAPREEANGNIAPRNPVVPHDDDD
jgi:hypothetical protein